MKYEFEASMKLLPRSIAARIREEHGHWIASPVNPKGYATVSVAGRTKQIHRYVYERVVGPIPDGLTIDHLCREKACCNPSPRHLEVVSNSENVRRGNISRRVEREAELTDAMAEDDPYLVDAIVNGELAAPPWSPY